MEPLAKPRWHTFESAFGAAEFIEVLHNGRQLTRDVDYIVIGSRYLVVTDDPTSLVLREVVVPRSRREEFLSTPQARNLLSADERGELSRDMRG